MAAAMEPMAAAMEPMEAAIDPSDSMCAKYFKIPEGSKLWKNLSLVNCTSIEKTKVYYDMLNNLYILESLMPILNKSPRDEAYLSDLDEKLECYVSHSHTNLISRGTTYSITRFIRDDYDKTFYYLIKRFKNYVIVKEKKNYIEGNWVNVDLIYMETISNSFKFDDYCLNYFKSSISKFTKVNTGECKICNDYRIEPIKLIDEITIFQDPLMECMICKNNKKKIAFVPCGHFFTCYECTLYTRFCQLCGKNTSFIDIS